MIYGNNEFYEADDNTATEKLKQEEEAELERLQVL